MKSIELTQDEINEVCAKLANQLETYGDSASDELKNAFMKMMNAEPSYKTTLMIKFENIYRNSVN